MLTHADPRWLWHWSRPGTPRVWRRRHVLWSIPSSCTPFLGVWGGQQLPVCLQPSNLCVLPQADERLMHVPWAWASVRLASPLVLAGSEMVEVTFILMSVGSGGPGGCCGRHSYFPSRSGCSQHPPGSKGATRPQQGHLCPSGCLATAPRTDTAPGPSAASVHRLP